MTRSRVFATALLAAAAVLASALSGGAAPTPVPGGANQVKAVDGIAGEPLWNGVVRLKVQELRDARAEDNPESLLPGPNQKVMLFRASLRNGTAQQFAELLTYTLADKDDVTFEIPSQYLKPSPLVVAQGAAARVGGLFIADKSFVPVKLLIQCATCAPSMHFRAFRVKLPAPAASP
ncbi:MAG TPA: hypothetical protein VN224_05930 [Xanthomonadales bacterium]|nr:hypothetical protein [Xanthomonadales bacterium]